MRQKLTRALEALCRVVQSALPRAARGATDRQEARLNLLELFGCCQPGQCPGPASAGMSHRHRRWRAAAVPVLLAVPPLPLQVRGQAVLLLPKPTRREGRKGRLACQMKPSESPTRIARVITSPSLPSSEARSANLTARCPRDGDSHCKPCGHSTLARCRGSAGGALRWGRCWALRWAQNF